MVMIGYSVLQLTVVLSDDVLYKSDILRANFSQFSTLVRLRNANFQLIHSNTHTYTDTHTRVSSNIHRFSIHDFTSPEVVLQTLLATWAPTALPPDLSHAQNNSEKHILFP